MREYEPSRESVPEEGSEALADRLEALNMDSVERVLRRAIELQFDDDHGPDTLDPQRIERVAEEIGIDASHVRRALFEEATASEEVHGSGLDRMFAPASMKERAMVDGDATELKTTIDTWLEKHEGLQKRRLHGHGAVWERDPSPVASIRMGLHVGKGTGSIRGVGPITHHVHSVEARRHLVTLEADTRRIARVAKGLLAAGVGLGAVLAFVFGVQGGFLAALTGGGAAVVAGIGAAFATAKTWASSIRKGLRRAVDAIQHPEVAGVHETVFDRIERALRQFSSTRRNTPRR